MFSLYQVNWEAVHDDDLVLRVCSDQLGREGLAGLVASGGRKSPVEVGEDGSEILQKKFVL